MSRLRLNAMITCTNVLLPLYSIDAKRLQNVEEEIRSQGGDVLSVAGDVGADDFPKIIVDATIEYVVRTEVSITLII